MTDSDWLATRFDADRPHLARVAYRMLGSRADAEDVVQDAWVRVSRAGADEIENLTGWFTTVVSRLCLNALQTPRVRRERPLDERSTEPVANSDPEGDAVLADTVGAALLVVLDTLSPAERLAFVLHDLFALPFDEVAEILDRTPAATRQLASRARRRVQGRDAVPADPDSRARKQQVVDAFLAASREGDFDALFAVLDPDVVLRADASAVRAAAEREAYGAPRLAPRVQGAAEVAEVFGGRAKAARRAVIDGHFGAVWVHQKVVRAVFDVTVADGRVAMIELVTDEETIAGMEIVLR